MGYTVRSRGESVVQFVYSGDIFLIMPAKRDKRAAAKVPRGLEENESNAEEQEIEKEPVKKKGRVPKAKAVPEQAEKLEAPEKKPGRGRKNKSDPETHEDEGVSKDEGGGEATATASKRGQAWKKTETEKPMDAGAETQESQRKGAVRTTKKATTVVEVAGEKEQKPGKGRGKKVAEKGVESEDAEPAVKKSRRRPKTKEDSSETKPNRKVRQQKNISKGKEVTEGGGGLAENGGSDQNADKDAGHQAKELRVNVEHW